MHSFMFFRRFRDDALSETSKSGPRPVDRSVDAATNAATRGDAGDGRRARVGVLRVGVLRVGDDDDDDDDDERRARWERIGFLVRNRDERFSAVGGRRGEATEGTGAAGRRRYRG